LVTSAASQFEVWRLGPRRGAKRPSPDFVLVLQSNRLESLATVITAPLVRPLSLPPLGRIRPELFVEGERYLVVFDRLAVIERSFLSKLVLDASEQEWAFKAAFDELLF
jgi:hypothetical protein